MDTRRIGLKSDKNVQAHGLNKCIFPANIYLFKVYNKNFRKAVEYVQS